MTLTPAPATLPRDRYGRPMVTPPDGGKPVAYTRCTTYIDVLEDKFNLQKWMQRMVALGLAGRPDLVLAVQAHRDDKRALDRVCEDAREAAAASAAATTGTALHALTERVDRGEELPVLPAEFLADLEAYRAATAELKPLLIEPFCVLDTLKIGGTPDRIVEYRGRRYISDLKTGSIDWGALKIAMQLAVYSRSRPYDIATGERMAPHEADMSRGIIVHLPAGQAKAELHWVDLEAGWYAVQVATQVRDKRKLKFKDLTEPFGPVASIPPGTVPGNTAMTRARNAAPTLREQIHACGTADEVRALWAANASDWTDQLTAAAGVHIANLGVTA